MAFVLTGVAWIIDGPPKMMEYAILIVVCHLFWRDGDGSDL